MKEFIVQILFMTAFTYFCRILHHVNGDTIGGISPEKWNEKCKQHFDDYGEEEAPHIHIYIPGYCERYHCQQYGYNMYGVTTEECRRVAVHRDNCRIVAKKNKQYPFCCPQLECDRRKPRMHVST